MDRYVKKLISRTSKVGLTACFCVLCVPVVVSFESLLSLYLSRWHAVVCSLGLSKLQANPLQRETWRFRTARPR